LPHIANKNYKAFLKNLLKQATDPLSSEDAKEIENAAGTIRADKVKAEKAAAAAKKGCEWVGCCSTVWGGVGGWQTGRGVGAAQKSEHLQNWTQRGLEQ
jgi:hypothetical protein